MNIRHWILRQHWPRTPRRWRVRRGTGTTLREAADSPRTWRTSATSPPGSDGPHGESFLPGCTNVLKYSDLGMLLTHAWSPAISCLRVLSSARIPCSRSALVRDWTWSTLRSQLVVTSARTSSLPSRLRTPPCNSRWVKNCGQPAKWEPWKTQAFFVSSRSIYYWSTTFVSWSPNSPTHSLSRRSCFCNAIVLGPSVSLMSARTSKLLSL